MTKKKKIEKDSPEAIRADLKSDIAKVKRLLGDCNDEETSMAYYRLLMILVGWARSNAS